MFVTIIKKEVKKATERTRAKEKFFTCLLCFKTAAEHNCTEPNTFYAMPNKNSRH